MSIDQVGFLLRKLLSNLYPFKIMNRAKEVAIINHSASEFVMKTPSVICLSRHFLCVDSTFSLKADGT